MAARWRRRGQAMATWLWEPSQRRGPGVPGVPRVPSPHGPGVSGIPAPLARQSPRGPAPLAWPPMPLGHGLARPWPLN